MKHKLIWKKWFPEDHDKEIEDNWDDDKTPYDELESKEDMREIHSAIFQVPNHQVNPLLDEKHFNFWMGHSNFYLTKDIVNIICNTKGIESLTPISPYRMRIAVGELFKPGEVMSDITKKVIGHIDG